MRYNPNKACSIYFEWPNPWEIKPWFREPPKKKRKLKVLKPWLDAETKGKKKTIPYWRDIERAGKPIQDKHLYFPRWPEHRRKPFDETILPFNMKGLRFIKNTMGPPLGWTYREGAVNLQEKRRQLKLERKNRIKARKDKRKKRRKEKKGKGKKTK